MNIDQRTNYALGQALRDYLRAELQGDVTEARAMELTKFITALHKHLPGKEPVLHWAQERLIEFEMAFEETLMRPVRPAAPKLCLVTPEYVPDDIPF